MSSSEGKPMRKEAAVRGPTYWMRVEERDTVELHVLNGRCMASAGYAGRIQPLLLEAAGTPIRTTRMRVRMGHLLDIACKAKPHTFRMMQNRDSLKLGEDFGS
jgi:hypothetical protein